MTVSPPPAEPCVPFGTLLFPCLHRNRLTIRHEKLKALSQPFVGQSHIENGAAGRVRQQPHFRVGKDSRVPFIDSQLPQITLSCPHTLPLLPDHPADSSSHPFIRLFRQRLHVSQSAAVLRRYCHSNCPLPSIWGMKLLILCDLNTGMKQAPPHSSETPGAAVPAAPDSGTRQEIGIRRSVGRLR